MNRFNLPDHSTDLLKLLLDGGSLTQKEIIDKLDLPVRTIRYAIRRLKEEQMIKSKPDLLDMRSLRYEINDKMAEEIETVLNTVSETTV